MRSPAPSAATELRSSNFLRLVSVAFLLTASVAICISATQNLEAASVEYRVVDKPAEHGGGGALHLSTDGSVLWEALLSDGNGGFIDCLFHEGGPPFPLVCEGDSVTEPSGATLSRIDEFVESIGRIAVDGAVELADPGGELDGVWVGTAGTLSVVALENDGVPGLPGVSWSSFATLRLNRRGMVCFAAVLKGSGIDSTNRDSYWCAANGGEPQLLARIGDPVPGRPGEDVVGFSLYSPAYLHDVELDDVGMNIFQMETTGGHGLFRMSSSSATTLAFEGESEPLVGLVYSGFDGDLIGSQPVWANQNGSGHAYTAHLGTNIDDILTDAVFSWAGTGFFRLVAKTGDLLPGGATMGFTGVFAANVRGDVVWEDNGYWGDDLALYAERDGLLQKLLEIGDPAPGARSPTDVFKQFNLISMNGHRQVIVHADIGYPTGSDSESLWVLDPAAGAVLVAEDYGQIDFGGDIRTIRSVSFWGGDLYGGWRSSYNEGAEFVFRASFSTDPITLGFVVARVVPTTPIFVDGFESGDTANWD
jgi:hypothetical protein